jgi:hypothetical protein
MHINFAADDAKAEVEKIDRSQEIELTDLEIDKLSAETNYLYFKRENKLHRDPSYPESQIFHWSFIAALALAESILNGVFLAKILVYPNQG